MFTVEEILKICHGKLLCGNKTKKIQSFSKDTRTITKNDTYLGIKGSKFNGNIFYKNAFDKGVQVCILDDKSVVQKEQNTIIIVEDTVKAIQILAHYLRKTINVPIVAITGSVGKTSTKDMIANVLNQKYKVLKTEGNYNNQIGVPLTLLKYNNEDIIVIEMGMNNLNEIRTLTNIVNPNIAVITNIGTAHIGILGSRENILKAKLEIIEGLKNPKIVVVNNDNDLLHNVKIKQKKITCGIKEQSDYMATDIHLCDNYSEIVINQDSIRVPIFGLAYVHNALLAYAVGSLLKLSKMQLKQGIETCFLTRNRLDVIKLNNNITLINDCYNANLDSMINAIDYLNNVQGNKKIAFLGDMFELGKYSKQIHQQVGEYILNHRIDVLITVGKDSKYIAKKATGIKEVYTYLDIKAAYTKLQNILKPKDVILVKASNGMHFIDIVNQLQEDYPLHKLEKNGIME